ncbi:hypothetical protein [Shouchella patagoniensis]|uniref:hypothetical protein n=1 Tax=Shouchella patagoniensis TaxID=228576 RepID=UPI000995940F|nr:hypothetical protein [Shouchella patagoniensis]
MILLDVTLRDGGYLNQFNFKYDSIHEILLHLENTNVDYVELGYYKGPASGGEGLGVTANINLDVLEYFKELFPKIKFVIMLHPKNVSIEELEVLSNKPIDLIRVCITEASLDQGLEYVKRLKRMNHKVSANFTRATWIDPHIIASYMKQAENNGADIVYFADSNGSMYPDKVAEYVKTILQYVNIPVGFHPHNNLNLALANSITAIQHGAKYVDSSLNGLGKGGGNLETEIFISYLERTNQNQKFDLLKAFEGKDYIIKEFSYSSDYLLNLLFGIKDYSMDYMKVVTKECESNNFSVKDYIYHNNIKGCS